MNWEPKNGGGDNAIDEVVTVLALAFGVVYFAPELAPQLAAQAGAWLVKHSVLVPEAAAVLSVPHTGAGLDAGRIVGAIALLVVLGALTHQSRARRRKEARR